MLVVLRIRLVTLSRSWLCFHAWYEIENTSSSRSAFVHGSCRPTAHGRNCARTAVHDVCCDAFSALAQACRLWALKHILRWQLVALTMARQDAQRRPRNTGFWFKNLLGAKRLAAQACDIARAVPLSAYYATKESTRMAGTWQLWFGIGSRSRKVLAQHKRRPVAAHACNHS